MTISAKPFIPEGLSNEEARRRLEQGLDNRTNTAYGKTIGQILRGNLCTVFNLVNFLIAAAVLIAGSYKNVLFMGVVLSNLALGIIQELRARTAVRRLTRASETPICVIREGCESHIPREKIVLGDVIRLSAGDRVPVDGAILSGTCEADFSALTGESVPVSVCAGTDNDTLYAGTFLISGSCFMCADAVGENTREAGISRAARTHKPSSSEIMRTLNMIVSAIAVVILPLGALLLWRQTRLTPFIEAVVNTGAALINMIPEGLMLLTSSVLALSVIRLSGRGVLCRELASIESLARIDLICLDKTGTITGGNMELASVIPLSDTPEKEIERILSRLTSSPDNSPTMQALRRSFPPDSSAVPTRNLDFSAARKRSGMEFADGAYLLGAPDWVMRPSPLPETVSDALSALPSDLHTLLLIRAATLPLDGEAPSDVIPLAVIVLRDHIRETARETFRYFLKEGVALRVVSGDSAEAASAAAVRAGIPDADRFIDASGLSDDELRHAAETHVVFGRVTPSQKRLLVEAYHDAGHMVCMTGDGVNDVPALRAADCSAAMASGADAARAVAKLVLLDSDFDAMPQIVAEGRRCINNLQRSASLFLIKTIYAAFFAVLFLFVPWEYPFIPIQLTLVSAATIGIPSFLLALEPCFDRIRGNFLSGVLNRAFPGAFAVMLTVPAAEIILRKFGADASLISTVCIAVCGTAGLLTVLHASLPFNRWRGFVMSGMLLLFCIGFFLFPGFFEFAPVLRSLPYVFPAAAVCAALCELFRFILQKLTAVKTYE